MPTGFNLLGIPSKWCWSLLKHSQLLNEHNVNATDCSVSYLAGNKPVHVHQCENLMAEFYDMRVLYQRMTCLGSTWSAPWKRSTARVRASMYSSRSPGGNIMASSRPTRAVGDDDMEPALLNQLGTLKLLPTHHGYRNHTFDS